jgi:DNA-binding transcriptional LysR family regulator
MVSSLGRDSIGPPTAEGAAVPEGAWTPIEYPAHGLRGTLRVGMLSDLGLIDLPGLARDFRDRHPGVELKLRGATVGSSGMLAALSNYDIDVAFAGSSGPLPREYDGRELLRVPQLLAVPADHPLAGRREVAIRELEHEAFIDLPPGFAMRTLADDVFTTYGLHRAIAAEVGGIDATAALLALASDHLIPQPGVERPA